MHVFLRPLKGTVPIIVWRRASWTSMPHIHVSPNYMTRCGRDVRLGHGIVAITITQITSEMMSVVGCGHCMQSLLSDMRHDIDNAKPDIRNQWKNKLSTFNWYRPGDELP